jgi:hypothetical protein
MHAVQLAVTEGPARTPQVVDPPELVPEPVPLELDPVPPPQGLTTGTHALIGLPSTVEMGVHASPDGQDWPALQSAAQNESPPNWPQSLPAPQSALVTHRSHAPLAPPSPVPVDPPVPPAVAPVPVRVEVGSPRPLPSPLVAQATIPATPRLRERRWV